jgi:hypothetical protein
VYTSSYLAYAVWFQIFNGGIGRIDAPTPILLGVKVAVIIAKGDEPSNEHFNILEI